MKKLYFISIHALLAESDKAKNSMKERIKIFLSTLSLRRATRSDPALRAQKVFLSTLSLRRATNGIDSGIRSIQFLSTLSLRRATAAPAIVLPARGISIHALLAESDCSFFAGTTAGCIISIHALLAESDARPSSLEYRYHYFYPRSPCGERRIDSTVREDNDDFYPRSPCGERHGVRKSKYEQIGISIHALLAESDSPCTTHGQSFNKFLSTLSLRRATAKVHKTVGHFCAYETNFMGIASSC